MVDSFLEGYNTTILAYGQTGSGKTFTMGSAAYVSPVDEFAGILPRCIFYLFERIHCMQLQSTIEVSCSFLELYNEEFRDLLTPTSGSGNLFASGQINRSALKSPIRITEDPETHQILIMGAHQEHVKSTNELLGCLMRGADNRTVGTTNMNASSSRSHAIFTIYVSQRSQDENKNGIKQIITDNNADLGSGSITFKSSKFHFVDLAGSERAKRTKAEGARLREGIHINSGLLALGNVINALTEDVDGSSSRFHVPYRSSKLTRILQDSLGGNSKTLMLACVSGSSRDLMETNSTLKYASRARNIRNQPIVNRDPTSQLISDLRAQVHELQTRLSAVFGNNYRISTTEGALIDTSSSTAVNLLPNNFSLSSPTRRGSASVRAVVDLNGCLSHEDAALFKGPKTKLTVAGLEVAYEENMRKVENTIKKKDVSSRLASILLALVENKYCGKGVNDLDGPIETISDDEKDVYSISEKLMENLPEDIVQTANNLNEKLQKLTALEEENKTYKSDLECSQSRLSVLERRIIASDVALSAADAKILIAKSDCQAVKRKFHALQQAVAVAHAKRLLALEIEHQKHIQLNENGTGDKIPEHNTNEPSLKEFPPNLLNSSESYNLNNSLSHSQNFNIENTIISRNSQIKLDPSMTYPIVGELRRQSWGHARLPRLRDAMKAAERIRQISAGENATTTLQKRRENCSSLLVGVGKKLRGRVRKALLSIRHRDEVGRKQEDETDISKFYENIPEYPLLFAMPLHVIRGRCSRNTLSMTRRPSTISDRQITSTSSSDALKFINSSPISRRNRVSPYSMDPDGVALTSQLVGCRSIDDSVCCLSLRPMTEVPLQDLESDRRDRSVLLREGDLSIELQRELFYLRRGAKTGGSGFNSDQAASDLNAEGFLMIDDDEDEESDAEFQVGDNDFMSKSTHAVGDGDLVDVIQALRSSGHSGIARVVLDSVSSTTAVGGIGSAVGASPQDVEKKMIEAARLLVEGGKNTLYNNNLASIMDIGDSEALHETNHQAGSQIDFEMRSDLLARAEAETQAWDSVMNHLVDQVGAQQVLLETSQREKDRLEDQLQALKARVAANSSSTNLDPLPSRQGQKGTKSGSDGVDRERRLLEESVRAQQRSVEKHAKVIERLEKEKEKIKSKQRESEIHVKKLQDSIQKLKDSRSLLNRELAAKDRLLQTTLEEKQKTIIQLRRTHEHASTLSRQQIDKVKKELHLLHSRNHELHKRILRATKISGNNHNNNNNPSSFNNSQFTSTSPPNASGWVTYPPPPPNSADQRRNSSLPRAKRNPSASRSNNENLSSVRSVLHPSGKSNPLLNSDLHYSSQPYKSLASLSSASIQSLTSFNAPIEIYNEWLPSCDPPEPLTTLVAKWVEPESDNQQAVIERSAVQHWVKAILEREIVVHTLSMFIKALEAQEYALIAREHQVSKRQADLEVQLASAKSASNSTEILLRSYEDQAESLDATHRELLDTKAILLKTQTEKKQIEMEIGAAKGDLWQVGATLDLATVVGPVLLGELISASQWVAWHTDRVKYVEVVCEGHLKIMADLKKNLKSAQRQISRTEALYLKKSSNEKLVIVDWTIKQMIAGFNFSTTTTPSANKKLNLTHVQNQNQVDKNSKQFSGGAKSNTSTSSSRAKIVCPAALLDPITGSIDVSILKLIQKQQRRLAKYQQHLSSNDSLAIAHPPFSASSSSHSKDMQQTPLLNVALSEKLNTSGLHAKGRNGQATKNNKTGNRTSTESSISKANTSKFHIAVPAEIDFNQTTNLILSTTDSSKYNDRNITPTKLNNKMAISSIPFNGNNHNLLLEKFVIKDDDLNQQLSSLSPNSLSPNAANIDYPPKTWKSANQHQQYSPLSLQAPLVNTCVETVAGVSVAPKYDRSKMLQTKRDEQKKQKNSQHAPDSERLSPLSSTSALRQKSHQSLNQKYSPPIPEPTSLEPSSTSVLNFTSAKVNLKNDSSVEETHLQSLDVDSKMNHHEIHAKPHLLSIQKDFGEREGISNISSINEEDAESNENAEDEIWIDDHSSCDDVDEEHVEVGNFSGHSLAPEMKPVLAAAMRMTAKSSNSSLRIQMSSSNLWKQKLQKSKQDQKNKNSSQVLSQRAQQESSSFGQTFSQQPSIVISPDGNLNSSSAHNSSKSSLNLRNFGDIYAAHGQERIYAVAVSPTLNSSHSNVVASDEQSRIENVFFTASNSQVRRWTTACRLPGPLPSRPSHSWLLSSADHAASTDPHAGMHEFETNLPEFVIKMIALSTEAVLLLTSKRLLCMMTNTPKVQVVVSVNEPHKSALLSFALLSPPTSTPGETVAIAASHLDSRLRLVRLTFSAASEEGDCEPLIIEPSLIKISTPVPLAQLTSLFSSPNPPAYSADNASLLLRTSLRGKSAKVAFLPLLEGILGTPMVSSISKNNPLSLPLYHLTPGGLWAPIALPVSATVSMSPVSVALFNSSASSTSNNLNDQSNLSNISTPAVQLSDVCSALIGLNDGRVIGWPLKPGAETECIQPSIIVRKSLSNANNSSIASISFVLNGKAALVANTSGTLSLLQMSQHNELHNNGVGVISDAYLSDQVLESHECDPTDMMPNIVTAVLETDGQRVIISTGKDGRIRFWEIADV